MPIEFIAGDLFANVMQAQAFAHGCNCQGSMGAGIAVTFREHYPAMFDQYHAKCKAQPRQFNLGDAWLWKEKALPWVFNLGTQEAIWHARASYEAIETAATRMKEIADAEGISCIAMPRIGVGYGGLSWKKVKVILERILGGWSGRAIVYETFIPADSAAPASAPAPSIVQRAPKRKGSSASRFHGIAVTVVCCDLEQSATFYETVLGASRLPTDNGIGRSYKLGKLQIHLLQNAESKNPATFPEHAQFMLWLEVADLERANERFVANQVQIVDEGDGQFMMIADPDGLLIEVWEKESAA